MQADSPLVVWRLRDGTPGHEKQTEGFIQAMNQRTNAVVEEFTWPLERNKLMAKWRKGRQAGPDLIVGAGHGVHLAMLASRTFCGGRTVVLMKPTLPLWLFDLALVPEHDQCPDRANVLRTEGMLCPVLDLPKDVQAGLILLGGESRHFDWDSQAVTQAVERIIDQRQDFHWQVGNSRRTPAELQALLTLPERARWVDYRECAADWLKQALAEASEVWVTADSASMVYEAMSSGAVVGIIELGNHAADDKLAQGIAKLVARGWVLRSSAQDDPPLGQAVYPISDLTSDPIVRPLREHLRCVDVVLRRWFPGRAQV